MAEQGQSKQQPKNNKLHRPRIHKALGIPKRKKNSSDSQTTPTPPGTATAIAWTELEAMFTNDDNTPDSERRISDHSQLEQRRNTSDNSSSSRNNPLPLYPLPSPPSHIVPQQQSSTVIESQPTHTQPHVPDDVNDDEVTNLSRALEKTQMERDRINNDKQILERRLSEYEDQLAASRVEHKRLQTGPVISPDNRITQLESLLQYERIKLNDMRREKEELLGSHKEQERMKVEMKHLQKEKEMTENNLAILQKKITDVAEEHRKEIETLRADVHLKDKTLEEQKEQYGTQLEETRNESERLMRTMVENLQQQRDHYETQLQQAREEIVINKADNDGASANSSLSEKDKEAARTAEQLMEREEEVTELKKQLQLKTMEATTLEERKYQLEQELTHMVDGTAVMAERAEIEKEKQDMEAERRHYKRMEATLLTEIEQLKQRLLHHTDDKQGGGDSVTDLKQQLEGKDMQMRLTDTHTDRIK